MKNYYTKYRITVDIYRKKYNIYVYVSYYVTMQRMNVSTYWITYKQDTNIMRSSYTLIQ